MHSISLVHTTVTKIKWYQQCATYTQAQIKFQSQNGNWWKQTVLSFERTGCKQFEKNLFLKTIKMKHKLKLYTGKKTLKQICIWPYIWQVTYNCHYIWAMSSWVTTELSECKPPSSTVLGTCRWPQARACDCVPANDKKGVDI